MGNWYLYFSYSKAAFFPLDFHPMLYCIKWEMHVSSHPFPIAWEKADFHTFSKYGCFFPLDSHPVVCFIIRETHGFFHQFPITWEKAAKCIEWEKGICSWKNPIKPIPWGEPGKLVLKLFHIMGAFSFRFSSYGILHHMGNARVSPFTSHSIGQCSEIHWIGTAWKIGIHTFPKSIPSGMLYHMRNPWIFPSVSESTGKYSKIHPVISLVVFPQYYFSCLFQTLVIP